RKQIIFQFQLLCVFVLCLLALHKCLAILPDYYNHLVDMPSHIKKRSIAAWSYVENINLNRVPQVIHEASCHSNHFCSRLNNTFGLETIPISLRMLVKKNPCCFPSASYFLEFEVNTIACLCAMARQS
uniref:Uncharacterized protein n=1 Tax=Mola mola TaxID=94237 RepID=A0A3Q3W4T0_MOLML